MKPSPKSDFPVSVGEQIYEIQQQNVQDFYQNIFWVRLNFTVEIVFIPPFDIITLSAPNPVIPNDIDGVDKEIEARLVTAFCSRHIVTPDRELAGTEFVWNRNLPKNMEDDPFPEVPPGVLFYVTPEEFETFLVELSDLAEELLGRHDSRRVSTLSHLKFVQLILSRIISSQYLSKYELWLLGRAKSSR
ncbi:hypothetical protein [Baaleninema simplex]|uniref:hypothetical protein n=1 Tax=Baaleninema simplex TaxID=2862350 RepID=UPI00036147E7|nr:hypothetical protein [Baaleninema simplex]